MGPHNALEAAETPVSEDSAPVPPRTVAERTGALVEGLPPALSGVNIDAMEKTGDRQVRYLQRQRVAG